MPRKIGGESQYDMVSDNVPLKYNVSKASQKDSAQFLLENSAKHDIAIQLLEQRVSFLEDIINKLMMSDVSNTNKIRYKNTVMAYRTRKLRRH